MSKYKCVSHKPDTLCRGCLIAWMERHNLLLQFAYKIKNYPGIISPEFISREAAEIIKTINGFNNEQLPDEQS